MTKKAHTKSSALKTAAKSASAKAGTGKVGGAVTPCPDCCSPPVRVAIKWGDAPVTEHNVNASSTTVPQAFVVVYTACRDSATGVWRMRVTSISGNADITINTGGSRNPDTNPPTTQAEAIDAVTVMKAYYANGFRGAWHTAAASTKHEKHHYREWKCSAGHYWPATQAEIDALTTPLGSAASPAAAAAAMKGAADAKIAAFDAKAKTYFFSLGDGASDRPYAAGQLVLNHSIQTVQALAKKKGWAGVPAGVDSPSTEPPCYKAFP